MPDVLLEVFQLLLDTLLFANASAVGRKDTALTVVGLIDLTLVVVQGEIIVSRHVGDVVQVRGHQRQT